MKKEYNLSRLGMTGPDNTMGSFVDQRLRMSGQNGQAAKRSHSSQLRSQEFFSNNLEVSIWTPGGWGTADQYSAIPVGKASPSWFDRMGH